MDGGSKRAITEYNKRVFRKGQHVPRTAMTLTPSKVGESLRVALATNNLRRICRAIDVAVRQVGVERVAQSANVNRITLYRAFRLRNGPALETMVRVLLVLGLALTVEVRSSKEASEFSRRVPVLQSGNTARFLTAAFRSDDLDRVPIAFAKILSLQENVPNSRDKRFDHVNIFIEHLSFPRGRGLAPS
jgi:DNA-binding phage protein